MHEKYWARICLQPGIIRRFCVTIFENENLVGNSFLEKEIKSKRTITAMGAKLWAEKEITNLVLCSPSYFFIREKDVIRRNWND